MTTSSTFTVRALLGYLAAVLCLDLARTGTIVCVAWFASGLLVIASAAPAMRWLRRRLELAQFTNEFRAAQLTARRAYAYRC